LNDYPQKNTVARDLSVGIDISKKEREKDVKNTPV